MIRWLIREPLKSIFELGTCMIKRREIMHPSEEPKKIILIPGFLSGGSTMFMLRRILNDNGHDSQYWGQGFNTGYQYDTLCNLTSSISSQPESVIIIGHSLGGIYAREIAKIIPEKVHKVITLATPFYNPTHNVNSHIKKLYMLMNGDSEHDYVDDLVNKIKQPPPMECHSFYTTGDSVVKWESCMQPDGHELCMNHRFDSSHMGIIADHRVIQKILTIL